MFAVKILSCTFYFLFFLLSVSSRFSVVSAGCRFMNLQYNIILQLILIPPIDIVIV